MPRSPVDQEDFQAWTEHPITKMARDQFRKRALSLAETEQASLFNRSPSMTAQEWADHQAVSAHQQGLCEGLMNFADIKYDAIREETDEEIKELESKA